MEIDKIIYKAKDGKTFTDPLKCEDYEKTLGIIPGSVGDFISKLKERAPKTYIYGVCIIKNNGKVTMYGRCTRCIDNCLEDYVNVSDLSIEDRYVSETVDNFIKELEKENQDAPCQYMILFSDSIDLKNPCAMANYNSKVWPQQ